MRKTKTMPVEVLQSYIDCVQSKEVDLLILARYLATKSNGLFEVVEPKRNKGDWILKQGK